MSSSTRGSGPIGVRHVEDAADARHPPAGRRRCDALDLKKAEKNKNKIKKKIKLGNEHGNSPQGVTPHRRQPSGGGVT